MVDPDEKDRVVSAILTRWPSLETRDQSPIVVRFADPGETHAGSHAQS